VVRHHFLTDLFIAITDYFLYLAISTANSPVVQAINSVTAMTLHLIPDWR
jgi:hypothetical protein